MFKVIQRIRKSRTRKRFNLLLLSSGFTRSEYGYRYPTKEIPKDMSSLLGLAGLTFVTLKKLNTRVDVGLNFSFVNQFPSLSEEAYVKPSYVTEFEDKNKSRIQIKPTQYESRFEEHQETFDKYFSENQIPKELENIVVVETRVRNDLVSSAGAKGPWQFMPATGKSFGLSSEEDFKDWDKSTSAAAKYLKYLYNKLHSWDLVVMAYNCGPGRYKSGSGGVLGAMYKAGIEYKDSYSQEEIWRIWKELKSDETKSYYLAYLYLKENNVYTKPIEKPKEDEEPPYININEDYRIPFSYNEQPLHKDSLIQDV